MALIALPHPEDHNPDRRAVIVDPANPSEDASDSNSGTSGQRRGQGQRPAALVDLAALLSDGYEPSFADVGITVDGVALFYRGKVNGLFGAPECGKTWIALWAAAQALTQGESVVYIDADHNGAAQILAWLGQLFDDESSIKIAVAEDRLHVAEPDCLAEIVEIAEYFGTRDGVAVVDSIGELEAMAGASADVNDRYLRLNRAVMGPLAQRGWTVITLDHLAKAGSGDFAIGASAKKRAVNGAYYKVTRLSRFAPGRAGSSQLSLEKDRCGAVASALGDHSITFQMDADGRPSIYACEMSPTPSEPSLEEAILEALTADAGGLSAREIRMRIARSDAQTRLSLTGLANAGLVRRSGNGASVRWHLCQ